MDKKEFEGKNLEEALHQASASLGIAEPDLDYEIIEQGRRGLFGIGAKSVRIRVMPPISPLEPQAAELLGVERPEGSRSRRKGRGRGRGRRGGREEGDGSQAPPAGRDPQRKRERPEAAAPRPPVSQEELGKVESKLQQMIDLMGLDLKVEATAVADSGISLELVGNDEELLNDRESELASSLQFVLNRMARRTWPDVGRIRLGDNGQSSGRDGEVIELVKEVAQQVLQTGETQRLHAMNAYERRLVDLTIRKSRGLGSRSEGDGAMKKVRIFKQEKKAGRPGRSRSRRGRGRKRADG